MTNEDALSNGTQDLSWAFAEIGMTPSVSTDSLQGIFLTRLEEACFVPSDEETYSTSTEEGDWDSYLGLTPEEEAEADDSIVDWSECDAEAMPDRPVAGEDGSIEDSSNVETPQPLSERGLSAFEEIFIARGQRSALPADSTHRASELQAAWHFERVESFAASYFGIEPAERRKEWRRLYRQCRNAPRARAWLRRLECGLEVSLLSPQEAKANVRRFANALCDLWVLAPAERARQMARFFTEHQPEAEAWSAAAVQLAQIAPKIAALEPGFLTDVQRWARKPRRSGTFRPPVIVLHFPKTSLRLGGHCD